MGAKTELQTLTDKDGPYIVYLGKACTTCHVQLTSRNRERERLLCKVHAKEADRLALVKRRSKGDALRGNASQATNPPSTPEGSAAHPPVGPRRRDCLGRSRGYHEVALRNALSWLIDNPFSPTAQEGLMRAGRDYELIERLRLVIPSDEGTEVPVQPPLPVPTEQAATAEQVQSPLSIPDGDSSFIDNAENSNPEHRTTRLEFLADAAYYRA